MIKKLLFLLPFLATSLNLFAAQPSAEEREYANLLVSEVRKINGLSAANQEDPKMLSSALEFGHEMATNHYCVVTAKQPSSARLGTQLISHVGAEERFQSCPRATRTRSEILASCTSWTAKEAAKQLVRQWFESPGHKDAMMSYHDYYAYAMVRTDVLPKYNGYQWFAIGLFADNQ